MKKILYAVAFLLMSGGAAVAQQLPQFSHYSFSGMYVSPGYAGMNDQTEISGIYRYQWLGYDTYQDGNSGSPQTQLVTASIPVSALKGGLGVQVFNDELGATDMLNAALSYSYHLNVGQGKLGIGLQGNVFNISKGDYRPNDLGDPSVPHNSSDSRFDLGAGVWYQSEKFYAGLGANNLLETVYEFEARDNAQEEGTKPSVTGARHLFLTAGYNISAGYNVVVTPTAIVKTDLNETNFEVGARAMFSDKYWGGLGYRHDDAVTALAGIGLLKENRLRIGYAFDLVAFNNEAKGPTSHEIMLTYRIPKIVNIKPAIKTPRYSF